MSDLRTAALAVLATWDKIHDAKTDAQPIELRLVILNPLIEEMKARIETLREGVEQLV